MSPVQDPSPEPLSRRALRVRLAALRSVKYDTPDLGLRDIALAIGLSTPALLYSFMRGAQDLADCTQQRLSHVFHRIDSGDLAKERDGGGRWVLRPVRNKALAQVATAARQKTVSILMTDDGPRLKL